MKKLIALVLVVITLVFTLTGRLLKTYSWGDKYTFTDMKLEVKASKSCFNKNDVNLTLFYSLYLLEDDESLDKIKDEFFFDASNEHLGSIDYSWEYVHALYIGNEGLLTFEIASQDNGWIEIADYENKVNAKMLKFIDYEDSFSTDYGHTATGNYDFAKTIHFNHSEELIIPEEFFDSSNGYIYVRFVRFIHNLDTDQYYRLPLRELTAAIEYDLILNNYVVLYK